MVGGIFDKQDNNIIAHVQWRSLASFPRQRTDFALPSQA